MAPAAPTLAEELAPAETVRARDPGDVVRLLKYLVVLVLGIIGARGAWLTTGGMEGDLVRAVGHLPTVVLSLLLVAVQTLHLLLFLGIPAALIVTRRWRLLALYTFGYAATAALVVLADRLLRITSGAPLQQLPVPDALRDWPASTALGTATFALVCLSPYLSRAWRRFGWGYVAVLAVSRVILSTAVVLDVLLAIGIGGSVASILLLIFGRRVLRPTPTAVMNALDRIGLFAQEVIPHGVTPAGSTGFTVLMVDGPPMHCKVVTSREYEADSLVRRVRGARLRGLGEDIPYSTVRRAATAEGMLAMSARRAGARTPALIGLAPLAVADGIVLAYEQVNGTSLARVAPDKVTDEVLDEAWRSVAALRSAGLAHRDLEAGNWLLGDDGQLWLVDFSLGEAAASDGALGSDVAELLAATSAVVGPDRAVAAAHRQLGATDLSTGLSYLVAPALTRATRAALKASGHTLSQVVDAAAEAAGVTEPEFAPIERIKPRSLVMAGMLALAIYVLLPQLADLPRMLDSIRHADLGLAAWAALASVATYVGSGLAISGSSPRRIPLLHSTLAALSATFVGSVTPPGVAHAGLNARFFTKQGMTPAVAISSTAAKEVAVSAVHIVMLVLLGILAGSSGALQSELDKLPPLHVIAIGLAVVIALVGAAFAVSRVRALFRDTVVPAVRESLGSLRELAADPVRVSMLFAGALTLQVGYVSALYFSVQALGGGIGFGTIGLIYLTVGSVASIAPTPGGLGAVEAVLLAALTGVGMAAAPALAAVFLFRILTFWIPIPLGGLSLRWLVSRDLL